MFGTPDNLGLLPRAVIRAYEHLRAGEEAAESSVLTRSRSQVNMRAASEPSVNVRVFQMWRDRFMQLTMDGPVDMPLAQVQSISLLAKTTPLEANTADAMIETIAALRARSFRGPAGAATRSHFIYLLETSNPFGAPEKNAPEITQGLLLGADLSGVARIENIAGPEEREDAKHINRSLLFLGRVADALSKNQLSSSIFQASPLTRVLELAFGGSSELAIFLNFCGMPGAIAKEETSVLLFGACVEALKLKPRRRRRQLTQAEFQAIMSDAEEQQRRYLDEFRELEDLLAEKRRLDAGAGAELKRLDAELQALRSEIAREEALTDAAREEYEGARAQREEAERQFELFIGQHGDRTEEKLAELTETLARTQEELATETGQFSELKATRAALVESLRTERRQCDEAKEEALALQQRLEQLEAELAAAGQANTGPVPAGPLDASGARCCGSCAVM